MSGRQSVGTLTDSEQAKTMVEEFKQVLTASDTRKKERFERSHSEDFDAEEGELLQEENEQEEEESSPDDEDDEEYENPDAYDHTDVTQAHTGIPSL